MSELRIGATGPAVETLSARLVYLGYAIDGVTPHKGARAFGPKVRSALRRFQSDHHLEADGIYGARSDAALKKAVADRKAERAAAAEDGKHLAPATGPDVSNNNGRVDYAKVAAAGHAFIGVKATEGLTFRDPFFTKANWEAMHRATLARLPYHFARPQQGRSGAQEAAVFCRALHDVGGLAPTDLQPCLDLETSTLGPVETRHWADDFIHEVIRQTGVEPIVYTGHFWREDVAQEPGDLAHLNLWLAAYVPNPDPYVPASWKGRGWSIWQRTEKGTCPGVSGACDLNETRAGLAGLRVSDNRRST